MNKSSIPLIHRILTTTALCLAALGLSSCDSRDIQRDAAFRWYHNGNHYVIELEKEALNPRNVNQSGLMSSETGRRTYTPLQHCIEHGDVEGVKMCLALGADPEKRVETMHHELLPGSKDFYQGTEGYTPLHLAVYLKQYKIVELLLEAGADIEGPLGPDGSTPLMSAAHWGDADMTRLLLNKGANAQAETGGKWCWESIYKGKTAMDFARESGHADCIELLMHHREKKQTE